MKNTVRKNIDTPVCPALQQMLKTNALNGCKIRKKQGTKSKGRTPCAVYV